MKFKVGDRVGDSRHEGSIVDVEISDDAYYGVKWDDHQNYVVRHTVSYIDTWYEFTGNGLDQTLNHLK
jgi:hypothetical protein